MKRQVLGILACVLALSGCRPKSCDVRIMCVRDDVGNYIVKWETDPPLKGFAKLYVSDVPEKFDMSEPVSYTPIEKQFIRYITTDDIQRKYFRVTFNDRYPQDVAARHIEMDNIQNFRDVGGYKSSKGKRLRWGMLYRSGSIHDFSHDDSIRLAGARLKTIIDLRTSQEVKAEPVFFPNTHIIHISIPCGDREEIHRRIWAGKTRMRDGILFMEDTYIGFIDNTTEELGDIFRLLLDKKNYPVLISDDLGKDRVGFFIALLFSVLDIPQEAIVREYMSVNRYTDSRFLAKAVAPLSNDAQETITVMLHANESYLNVAFREIENRFGSLDNYRETGLKISGKERNRLRDILMK